MIQAASVPAIAMAAITSYVGAYHLLVWVRSRRSREDLTFSLVCLAAALYDVGCAGLYSAASPAEGMPWQRAQRAAVALNGVAFAWFVADYTRRLSRHALTALTAVAGGYCVVTLVAPQWLFSTVAQVKRATLPWDATVVYNEVAVRPMAYCLEAFGLALFGLSFAAAVRQYRAGERRRAVPLLAALAVLSAGVVNDAFVAAGIGSSVYAIEYAFLAIIIVMAYRLAGEHRRIGEIERQLGASEQRYRTLVEGTDDLVLQVDRQGRILFANRGAAEVFGVPRETLVGMDAIDLVEAPQRERLGQILAGWRAGRAAAPEVEVRHVTVTGAIVDVLWRISPITEASGRVVSFNAIGHNVSDRKRFEEEMFARFQRLERQQEALLRLATDESVVSGNVTRAARRITETAAETLGVERASVWRVTPDGKRVACIDTYERSAQRHSLGMTLSLGGSRYFESVVSDRLVVSNDALDDPRLAELRESHLGPLGIGARLDAPVRVAGWFVGSVCAEHVGGPRTWLDDEIVFAGTLADRMTQAILNSDRRRSEGERVLLAAAVDQAGEVVVVTDAAGTIKYVNPAFERVTGYSKAEAVGNNPRILNSGKQDRAFYEELWQTIQSGETWRGRFVNRKKNGTLYIEDAVISPILDPVGRIASFVAVKRDMTSQVRLEEQLRQAQKMEAIGQLAGGVAHDFNNLLTPILGYAELLQVRFPAEDPTHAALAEVHRAAEGARRLTSQLLTFSRKQVIDVRVLDLGALVARMARMLRRTIREDIEVVVRRAPQPSHVHADASQIEQVLMNLAVNAQDAMPDGGRMIIETENVYLEESDVAARPGLRAGPHVLLSVSDTGTGMTTDVLAHVFEPFFTTKDVGKGTGLGLATAYGIVKQHGGDISVYSEPGHGATFRIYLPLSEQTPAEAERPVVAHVEHRGHETVMVAEDNPLVRNLTCNMLRAHGYRVLSAASGDECLRELAALDEPVDLMLVDVIMPGMNGRELYRRAAATQPSIKVLFMSGYSEEIIATQGILEGGLDFIAKPFAIESLTRKVREVLARQPPATADAALEASAVVAEDEPERPAS